MSRAASIITCLAVFVLSALALCLSLTMLHNRGLGFGFTPLCIVPAFVMAAVLGVIITKKKEKVRWIVVPTIAASAVLLWFAYFLFGEYRKHGQQTVGGGGGIVVMILLGLGAVLAVFYGISTAGIFLRPRKNENGG